MSAQLHRTFVVLDDVRVWRGKDAATIELAADPRVAVRLELGPIAATLSDQDIIDRHNQGVLDLAGGQSVRDVTLAALRRLLVRRLASFCRRAPQP